MGLRVQRFLPETVDSVESLTDHLHFLKFNSYFDCFRVFGIVPVRGRAAPDGGRADRDLRKIIGKVLRRQLSEEHVNWKHAVRRKRQAEPSRKKLKGVCFGERAGK